MLSKKSKLREAQKIKSVPRFSFRKASIGLVSAIISTTLWFASSKPQVVNADVIPDDPDQVNVQPSGAKAAAQELAEPEPTKVTSQTAPAKAQPTTKVANSAANSISATNTANTKQVTNDVANNSGSANNSNVTSTATSAAPNLNNSTPKQVAQPQTVNNGADQIPDDPQIAKAAPTKITAKKQTVPQIATTKSDLPVKTNNLTLNSNKLTARNNSDLADIMTRGEVTGGFADDDDPDHSKTINRNIIWYLKYQDGTQEEIARKQDHVSFGQKWTIYNDSSEKVWTPWEQDDRSTVLAAYTNSNLLNYLQTADTVNYSRIKKLFDTSDVSQDGAPAVTVKPLDQDITVPIYLTPRAAQTIKITVVYRDLDDNNKVLDQETKDATTGNNFKYDATSKINGFLAKNYTHDAKDDTLPSGIATSGITAPETDTVYYVGLHHKMIEYQPGENNPFTNQNDDANLVKQVTQTVKYQGTPNALPDNVQTTKFSRHGLTDMVTGKTTYQDWDKTSSTFQNVDSPTVEGYTPNINTVKGATVTPDSNDITKTVTYGSNDHLRPAIVHYRYDSWNSTKEPPFPDKNRNIITTGDDDNLKWDQNAFDEDIQDLPGYKGTVVKTAVQGGTIHAWIVYQKIPENNVTVHFVDQDNNNQPIKEAPDISGTNIIGKPISKPNGVDDTLDKLDKLGYEVAQDPFKNPTIATNGKQDVTYYLKHKKVAVSPKVERKEIVHYIDKDTGKQIAPDTTQTVSFTHNGTTDLVTGETTWTGWSADQTTNPVNVPVVDGYIASQKQVPGQTITPDKDVEISVPYNKIGQIIPVDDNGNEIPGAAHPNYVNDPDDPTKVKPNQKVPDVSGYTPEQDTVTPTDPTKNTPVKYHKTSTPTDDASLGINVHDDDTNQDLPNYNWSSGNLPSGSKVDYDWDNIKQQLIDHGYVIAQEPNIPKTLGKGAQKLTIHVKHGIVHVNPDKPQTPGGKINKGDATWPDKSQYEHNRQYIVHFVDSNGKTIAPDKVQTMRFGRDLQIDAVTGKILNPDAKWTPQNPSYEGVAAGNINGYRAQDKSINGIGLVNGVLPGPNAIDSDMSDSIVYDAVDQVPNDPGDGGKDSGKGNNDLGNPANSAKPKPASPKQKPAAEQPQALANVKAPAAKPTVKQVAAKPVANTLPQTGSSHQEAITATALGAAMILGSLGLVPKRKKQ